MSYEHWKTLHLLGVILLFSAFGALLVLALNDRTREVNRGRTFAMAVHGASMLLIIGAGIAIIGKPEANIDGMPAWVWAKVILWLLLGSAVMVIKRAPRSVFVMWLLLPLIGAVAAHLGLNRGF
ncbi:MAG: hypothetical protein ACE5F1_12975 [Planctomycetota bacterium]